MQSLDRAEHLGVEESVFDSPGVEGSFSFDLSALLDNENESSALHLKRVPSGMSPSGILQILSLC